MKESIFKTTKSNIEVFRQMADQYKEKHKENLANCKKNYIGQMLTSIQAEERENYRKKLNSLRTNAYSGIESEISVLKTEIMDKAAKKDYKALEELHHLSGLKLSQAEFQILCGGFNVNNYWTAKKLSEIAEDQGLEIPFAFCQIENQLLALDELKENCYYFIFGTNDEKGETFNRYGKNQQFGGFGDAEGKPNTYEQLYLVSDAEFSRLENMYENNNQIFSEDAFIDDLIKDVFSHEKATDRIHFLNNRMKRMTKKQREKAISKMSENEDLKLISQLCEDGEMTINPVPEKAGDL